MKVTSKLEDLLAGQTEGKFHLAMGIFDGMHIGHQAVIHSAIEKCEKLGGQTVVVTFDPHPRVVCGGQEGKAKSLRILANLDHKIRILEKMGIDHLVVIPFTKEFSQMPAQEFLANLLRLPIGSISVGEDWCFGAKRAGNVGMLREVAKRNGFEFSAIPFVTWEGERVSSTRIRAAISEGDFELAKNLLGHAYRVLGKVVYGNQLGRQMGFPTANMEIFNEQLPPNGVYAVKGFWKDSILLGMANLGFRPTVENGQKRKNLETHFFDWNGDLYGEELEIEFIEFLRPEKKFTSLDELVLQIKKDEQNARCSLARCLTS